MEKSLYQTNTANAFYQQLMIEGDIIHINGGTLEALDGEFKVITKKGDEYRIVLLEEALIILLS